MKTNTTHRDTYTKESSATNARSFRTFLLMQQFEKAAIGARIAQARKEAGGMTQEQLGELLNVSTRSVQDYEAGVTMPWKYFQTLQTVFGRSLQWFLHGDEEEPGVRVAETDQFERRLEELAALTAEGFARVETGIEALARRLDAVEPPGRQEETGK